VKEILLKTVEWRDGKVRMIDQTKLPTVEEFVEYSDPDDVAHAIRTLMVRGAPAIGVAAALGVASAAHHSSANDVQELLREVEQVCELLAGTRPTAVNLFWGIERMRKCAWANEGAGLEGLRSALVEEAKMIAEDDEGICATMGSHGAEVIPDGANVLTHCNAGSLACSDFGTAVGVIRAAHREGKKIHVWVDETRPLLQGARLTAWELEKEGIPHTLITDSMAGFVMAQGKVDVVVVGADRIAANGDVANKIGTYSVAVLAREHNIPFYVAAPMSTIDFSLDSGKHIPIEERNPDEVANFAGIRTAPTGTNVYNPAFDVTPNSLVAGIVTQHGVARPEFEDSLLVFQEMEAK